METSERFLLFEPEPRWALRLKGLPQRAARHFVQVRIGSEISRLLREEDQRLLLVSVRETMSAAQCAARIRQGGEARRQWPDCQVAFLLDERLDAWHRVCWEMGSGLLFVGTKSLPAVARTMQRFLDGLPQREVEAPQSDPLAWLPW